MSKKSNGRPVSRISTRLFVSIVAILTICFAVICIAAGPVLSTVLVYNTASDLIKISDRINSADPGSSAYFFELYSLAVNNNISFEIIDSSGIVSYQSSDGYSAQSSAHLPSSNYTEPEYNQTEQESVFKVPGSGTYEKRRKIATSAEYLVYSRELSTGDMLHIFSSVAVINSNVGVAVRVFSFISLIICFIMLAFVYAYARRFTKPLVEMNDVTRDMAALNFARRCEHYGNDEIGELGNSINALSATLDSTLMDLREKNIQLVKDIEHRTVLDTARREFINNVSHELKTPIAIISGYAEGLSAGISDDPKVIGEYCDIINEESKKMNGLVVQLLELSKLESSKAEITPAVYSLGSQITEVMNHFSILFKNHSISAESSVPENAMCFAQQDKIEIVLKNYISNAVSHCSGDMKIKVDCRENGENWRVSVFNTGNHIAKEDMDNIWTSFYRADKAHERSENRFGLGLSIVKAIMNNHSMLCGAENVDGGVKFWFEVKKERN